VGKLVVTEPRYQPSGRDHAQHDVAGIKTLGRGPIIADLDHVPVVGDDAPAAVVEPAHDLHGARRVLVRKADVDTRPIGMGLWGHDPLSPSAGAITIMPS
jgi:hypothetical protein